MVTFVFRHILWCILWPTIESAGLSSINKWSVLIHEEVHETVMKTWIAPRVCYEKSFSEKHLIVIKGFQCLINQNSARHSICPSQWRHNGHDGVSNHQPHDCLLNRLFRRRSKKTSKLRVTDLCAGNSPGTTQRASNAENVSIWWRHHTEEIVFRFNIYLKVNTCLNSVEQRLSHLNAGHVYVYVSITSLDIAE